jgi:hypothetical protein
MIVLFEEPEALSLMMPGSAAVDNADFPTRPGTPSAVGAENGEKSRASRASPTRNNINAHIDALPAPRHRLAAAPTR